MVILTQSTDGQLPPLVTELGSPEARNGYITPLAGMLMLYKCGTVILLARGTVLFRIS